MASDDIGKAVKDARIAALFAFFCVVLVGVLLMIDGQRNKWMAEQVGQVRQMFSEFGRLVDGAVTVPASPVVGDAAADVRGAGGDGAAGVVADGPAGEGVDPAGSAAAVPVNGAQSGRAGMAGGPRGHG